MRGELDPEAVAKALAVGRDEPPKGHGPTGRQRCNEVLDRHLNRLADLCGRHEVEFVRRLGRDAKAARVHERAALGPGHVASVLDLCGRGKAIFSLDS